MEDYKYIIVDQPEKRNALTDILRGEIFKAR